MDECELCAGSGEVTIIPVGGSDADARDYGCPMCIAKERDALQDKVWALADMAANSTKAAAAHLCELKELVAT